MNLPIIEGDMEDRGLFPSLIKLAGEAGTPKELIVPGVLKSSISSLKMMPVDFDINFEPKLK